MIYRWSWGWQCRGNALPLRFLAAGDQAPASWRRPVNCAPCPMKTPKPLPVIDHRQTCLDIVDVKTSSVSQSTCCMRVTCSKGVGHAKLKNLPWRRSCLQLQLFLGILVTSHQAKNLISKDFFHVDFYIIWHGHFTSCCIICRRNLQISGFESTAASPYVAYRSRLLSLGRLTQQTAWAWGWLGLVRGLGHFHTHTHDQYMYKCCLFSLCISKQL